MSPAPPFIPVNSPTARSASGIHRLKEKPMSILALVHFRRFPEQFADTPKVDHVRSSADTLRLSSDPGPESALDRSGMIFLVFIVSVQIAMLWMVLHAL
jgi:hypothetical protein